MDGVFDPPRDRVDRLRVFVDGVQGAVFPPAGDVGDRLAADVEPDRGADDVGDAVDDDLGSRAAELLIPDPEGVGELDPDTSDAGSTSPS